MVINEHIFPLKKLPDDTKYLRQNGATPSYGATYTKTPLDDKSNTENGDVVVHTGRNGVILENKAREYNTDVIYEPGKLYFHFRE